MEEITRARQYARALLALCPDRALAHQVGAELAAIARRIEAEPELRALLAHPELSLGRKLALLRQSLEGLSSPTQGLLWTLTRRRSLRLLSAVGQAFLALYRERYGPLEAEVEAARPLTAGLKQDLEHRLTQLTGRDVAVQERVNPELLGGVRIRIGDRVIDASVAGRLRQLVTSLTETR